MMFILVLRRPFRISRGIVRWRDGYDGGEGVGILSSRDSTRVLIKGLCPRSPSLIGAAMQRSVKPFVRHPGKQHRHNENNERYANANVMRESKHENAGD